MKTIEEHNKEAAGLEVSIHTFTHIPKWEPMGIMCPCGCERELLQEKWPLAVWRGRPIKCQETGRIGLMIYSDALRRIIKEIEWH